ncbi:MAG: HU family DNA-binding protein [Acutalibacteraceae bacterium]|nr:HU family DNA-binding protein [Acutalibacteraceae bacterium]
MNKTELVNSVAEKAGISKKDADKAVAAVVDSIVEALKAGDKVSLVGFGTFEVHERNARTGLNPRTKEKIEIPATKVPAFKAGATFKNAVK